jgi:hypothetical protein
MIRVGTSRCAPGGTGVEIFFRLGTEMRTSEVTVDIGTSSFEEVAEAMMRYNQVAAARAFGAALQKTRAPKLS